MNTRKVALALQHLVAMFGATVLVPILTGLNISVALFTAGLGTLLFHLITGRKVPVFLGSSFAFIAPIIAVSEQFGASYALGGIVAAGLVYVIMAGVVRTVGVERVNSFFPPVVTGPVVTVIGLVLAPVARDMASGDWIVAAITLGAIVVAMLLMKGWFKLLPVLTGVAVGYVAAIARGLVDFAPIREAAWLQIPSFTAPSFSWAAIAVVAPLALVTMIEHIGDIKANGSVVGKDFVSDPGLHRTLLGDGLATAAAGLFGGPANTTYSENTGVLAVTKVYDPSILRLTAAFAIALAFVGKFGAAISTIPAPVMGGASIILFGMIAAVGLRTLVENEVDLKQNRNLVIVAAILVFGISGATLSIGPLKLVGMSLAAVVGIALHKLLPQVEAAGGLAGGLAARQEEEGAGLAPNLGGKAAVGGESGA